MTKEPPSLQASKLKSLAAIVRRTPPGQCCQGKEPPSQGIKVCAPPVPSTTCLRQPVLAACNDDAAPPGWLARRRWWKDGTVSRDQLRAARRSSRLLPVGAFVVSHPFANCWWPRQMFRKLGIGQACIGGGGMRRHAPPSLLLLGGVLRPVRANSQTTTPVASGVKLQWLRLSVDVRPPCTCA